MHAIPSPDSPVPAPPQPLAVLAVAAREHLFTPGGGLLRPAVPADLGRRTAVALLDAIFMALMVFGATVVSTVLFVGVTGNDFDGPPMYDELGAWFLSAGMSGWAAVYFAAEAAWPASLGKVLCGLSIEPADAGDARPGRRRVVRWLVKVAPLFAVFGLSLGGFGYLWAGDDYDLEWSMPVLRALRWIIGGTLLAAAVGHVGWLLLRRETLHDRLAGTGVFRRRMAPLARGFEPVLRPVVRPPE